MSASQAPAGRVVIVVFDGLRPDMVTPDLMPHLCRFTAGGTHYTHSRAVFPSETRVNQASLVTGCWPRRHGITGNSFTAAGVAGGRLLSSGNDDDLLLVHEATGGQILGAASLGERLRAAGRQLAVVGSGTAGGTRLLHHSATSRECRFSLYRPDRSTPAALTERITGVLGEIPPVTVPCLPRLRYATDAFLRVVEPELAPDVSILWYFEPDWVYHYSGVGTPASLDALRGADAEFARVVEWWNDGPRDAGTQLLTLSDHGHVTTEGAPLDLVDELTRAGWRAGAAPDEGTELLAFLSRVGAIDVLPGASTTPAAVVSWLRGQPWCGVVCARDVAGTVPLAAVGLDHPDAPGIVFTTRDRPEANAHGRDGLARSGAAGLPPGGGNHGGLHPREMNNWFAAAGTRFAAGRKVAAPVGIIDVLPTVLECLGMASPDDVDGRSVLDPAVAAAMDHRRESVDTGYESLAIDVAAGRKLLDWAKVH